MAVSSELHAERWRGTHTSGQDRSRLTRQKTLEANVGMTLLRAAFLYNRFVVSGNDHQGSFLLLITSFSLFAWAVRPAYQLGF
jgi:hypothetical protein